MPTKTTPNYSLHKSSGQARVRIDRQDHYLGKFGSPESRRRYETLIAEWLRGNSDRSRVSLTVDALAILYFEYAETHYRKNGDVTSELSCVRIALRHLVRIAGQTKVTDFGPKLFKKVRESMIEAEYVRESINIHMGRIKRMFKWAVENEHLDNNVFQALCTVQGLQRGRTNAKEGEPVLPDELLSKVVFLKSKKSGVSC